MCTWISAGLSSRRCGLDCWLGGGPRARVRGGVCTRISGWMRRWRRARWRREAVPNARLRYTRSTERSLPLRPSAMRVAKLIAIGLPVVVAVLVAEADGPLPSRVLESVPESVPRAAPTRGRVVARPANLTAVRYSLLVHAPGAGRRHERQQQKLVECATHLRMRRRRLRRYRPVPAVTGL